MGNIEYPPNSHKNILGEVSFAVEPTRVPPLGKPCWLRWIFIGKSLRQEIIHWLV